jgi:hypothetical protein
MMKWRPYLNNRIIAEHPSGFYVIKSTEPSEGRPIFCPLCDSIMRTDLDEDAYKKFECCDSCATNWAYPNKEKWKDGWRPSSDEVSNKYNVRHT